MLGLDQAGLGETMEFMLNKMAADQQNQVVQNVFLTGGSANLAAFSQRIDAELRHIRPFQSHFTVNTAGNLTGR